MSESEVEISSSSALSAIPSLETHASPEGQSHMKTDLQGETQGQETTQNPHSRSGLNLHSVQVYAPSFRTLTTEEMAAASDDGKEDRKIVQGDREDDEDGDDDEEEEDTSEEKYAADHENTLKRMRDRWAEILVRSTHILNHILSSLNYPLYLPFFLFLDAFFGCAFFALINPFPSSTSLTPNSILSN